MLADASVLLAPPELIEDDVVLLLLLLLLCRNEVETNLDRDLEADCLGYPPHEVTSCIECLEAMTEHDTAVAAAVRILRRGTVCNDRVRVARES